MSFAYKFHECHYNCPMDDRYEVDEGGGLAKIKSSSTVLD